MDVFFAEYTRAQEQYGWVPSFYVAAGIFGAGNYLALYPSNLLLIWLNAAFQVFIYRAAYHGITHTILIMMYCGKNPIAKPETKSCLINEYKVDYPDQ